MPHGLKRRSGVLWDSHGTASSPHAATPRIDPRHLGYLVGPVSFGLVLVLERFNMVARHPVWVWVTLFLAIPLITVAADTAYRRRPDALHRQALMAVHAATVTTAIYLTGWGPVLIPAYAIGALTVFSRDGSHMWRATAAWSLSGVLVGQVLIAFGSAPSFLSLADAQAVATMSAFVLCVIIRIAAATVEQREMAEASARKSEESLRANEQTLRRRERRFRSLVANSADATLVVDANRRITYASPAVSSLLGVSPEDIVGDDPLTFVHLADVEKATARLHNDLQLSDVSSRTEVTMRGRDGRMRDVEAVVTDLRADPAVEGFVINIRDITDRKAAEVLLVHEAHHDGLTGLPNRTVVLQRADETLVRCRAKGTHLAVFFLDLDYFKDVNDTLGHETGDEVLRVVASRLVSSLREGETVGRMGGDEFVVLAETPTTGESIAAIARRLQEALRDPIAVLGDEGPLVQLTISLGVADGTPESASELLREADLALYQAKLAGRDAWVRFVPEMRSAALRRLQLQAELATALEESQFTLLFQPIIDMEQGQMTKVEALLRWEHPLQGTVSPDQFIPALEQSGHIVEVGRWVMDEACRQASHWWSQGHDIAISVNASTQEFNDPGYVDGILDTIRRHRLPPGALIVEITEHGLLDASETATRSIVSLKEHGVRVAIDDFGTGYASLSYLLQFDPDVLKIDRSFVDAMTLSGHAMAVVRAVVQLGKALDLEVIAEGIEESEQLALLRAEGCRHGQGHLFSRPVAPSAIAEMLAVSQRALA